MTAAEPNPESSLTWTVHPVVDRPRAAMAMVALILAILALVRLNYPEPGWTAFAAVILCLSLARFFFPTTYRLDDEGIHTRFLGISRDYRWGVYRRIESGRNGVFLSPFVKPDRLDNFRGLMLLAGSNREAVEAFARKKIFGQSNKLTTAS